ncbi:MAG: YdcF family protein [Bacteroidales bacterium]|nr:YdcF family protein [Bacteroidales bacterium]
MGKGRRPAKRSGSKANRVSQLGKTLCKWFFGLIGGFSFLLLVLSFTDIPFYAYYRLGTAHAKLTQPPDLIVLLSGSGMPSPDGMINAYYGAEAARQFDQAKIVIALPYSDGDSLQSLRLMTRELTLRGIDSSRILFEPHGFNTRSQAVNLAALFPDKTHTSTVLLISAPEHIYRAVKTFTKVGFASVGGLAAFDKPIDAEKVTDHGTAKDIRVKSLSLRYNMWSYLHYELYVLREYAAISYYKLKGWI